VFRLGQALEPDLDLDQLALAPEAELCRAFNVQVGELLEYVPDQPAA